MCQPKFLPEAPAAAEARPDSSKKRKAPASSSNRTRILSLEELQENFHLPINEVACKLGICVTVLKQQCRELGIVRWPYRKVRKLDNMLTALENSGPGKARPFALTNGEDERRKKITTVKKTLRELMSDPNSSAHLKLGKVKNAAAVAAAAAAAAGNASLGILEKVGDALLPEEEDSNPSGGSVHDGGSNRHHEEVGDADRVVDHHGVLKPVGVAEGGHMERVDLNAEVGGAVTLQQEVADFEFLWDLGQRLSDRGAENGCGRAGVGGQMKEQEGGLEGAAPGGFVRAGLASSCGGDESNEVGAMSSSFPIASGSGLASVSAQSGLCRDTKSFRECWSEAFGGKGGSVNDATSKVENVMSASSEDAHEGLGLALGGYHSVEGSGTRSSSGVEGGELEESVHGGRFGGGAVELDLISRLDRDSQGNDVDCWSFFPKMAAMSGVARASPPPRRADDSPEPPVVADPVWAEVKDNASGASPVLTIGALRPLEAIECARLVGSPADPAPQPTPASQSEVPLVAGVPSPDSLLSAQAPSGLLPQLMLQHAEQQQRLAQQQQQLYELLGYLPAQHLPSPLQQLASAFGTGNAQQNMVFAAHYAALAGGSRASGTAMQPMGGSHVLPQTLLSAFLPSGFCPRGGSFQGFRN